MDDIVSIYERKRRSKKRLRGAVRRLMRAMQSGTEQVVIFNKDLQVVMAVLYMTTRKDKTGAAV